MDKLLSTLKQFMFTPNNITALLKREDKVEEKDEEKVNVIKKPQNIFIPKYKDTLFWCFYIITKGWENFHLIGRRGFLVEKNHKILCIEQLRNAKELLKKNRWRRNELENDLINQHVISKNTFICLCALHNINVILIDDFCYYSYCSSSLHSTFYIKKFNNRYGIYTESVHDIKKELSTSWEIKNIKKPLKGISAYKVSELKQICKKLKIVVNNKHHKYNKKDIYRLIQSKLNKDFLY